MGAGESRERVEHDHDVPAELDLSPGVIEDHIGGSHVAFVGQIEARRDHLASSPVHHFADFFRPLIDEQDQQARLRMILRDRLRDGLEHHRLSRLGR